MDYALFRARLRTARLRANLSQAALAAKIETYQPYVSALERGTRVQLKAETFLKLAQALDVSPGWLAGEEG